MSWLAPVFLVGLLGVGLPLWLHRLAFRDPDPRPFSSSLLLEHSELTSAVEPRLRYLLLLAARIAMLVVLAVLFAEPVWRLDSPAAVQDLRINRLFVIDNSLSMAAGDTWARAVRRLESRIDSLGEGETGQLAAASDRVSLLTEPSADKGALRARLREARPSNAAIDYGEVVRAADQFARQAEREGRVSTELVFVTDAQATNMPARFADLIPTHVARTELDIIDRELDPNWTLSGQDSAEGVIARVSGFDTPAGPVRVEAAVEGEVVRQVLIELGPSASGSTLLRDLPLRTGENAVHLRLLGKDGLVVDNDYFLVVSETDELRVLVLAAELSLEDAVYLESALDSVRSPRMRVDTGFAGAGLTQPLADYAFVVVADAGSVSPANQESLRRFVEGGGALLIATGQKSTQAAQLPITGHVIEPGAGSDAQARERPLPVELTDVDHPALRQLEFGSDINVFRSIRVTAQANDKTLITLSSGAPWLLEHALGTGKVLLLTSPFDNTWSNLSVSPAFVPLIRSLSRYLAGLDELLAGAETGTVLSAGQTPGSEPGGSPIRQVFDPAGKPLLSLTETARPATVRLEDPGVYRLQTGRGAQLLPVNPPRRESDLSPISAESLSRWRAALNAPRGRGDRGAEPAPDAAQAPSGAGTETAPESSYPLFTWLLPLLTLALVVESAIGNAHLFVRRSAST